MRTCRPRRSLRAWRGRTATFSAAFLIGALMMVLGSRERNDLLAPGELTSHHAQVIARADWSDRCATCHPGGNDGVPAWVADAWRGDGVRIAEGSPVDQSTLCLECHRDMRPPGGDAVLAHGLRAGVLEGKARLAVVTAGLELPDAFGFPAHGGSVDDPLACAACHQEHHGALHDLTALTDARCQACHSERFGGFADGHPDFGAWPTTRRTRIAFNHASHSGEHFAKANREFDCRSCHLEDATGDLTARPTYQAACAECHEADLAKSFGDGLALVQLPTIDASLLDANAAWPDGARGELDGELSALNKLLLAADPDARDAMRSLGADFSFFDVDPEDAEQAAAALKIVEALRRLLDDLQEEGHGAVAYRLAQLTGRSETVAVSEYVGRLPVELIDRLQSTWFGDETTPTPFDAIEDRRTGGGWLIDDDRFALRYRPVGHDDPMVRAWLDAIVALPDEHAELREACLAEFTRPGAPGGCFECHSLERTANGVLTVNWAGRDRLNEPRGFTKFSHRPHLVQPELADCTHCHQLDTSQTSTAYAGTDPARFTSEFVALTKASCTECHRPHAAGDRCTQCHNYHVDPVQDPMTKPQ